MSLIEIPLKTNPEEDFNKSRIALNDMTATADKKSPSYNQDDFDVSTAAASENKLLSSKSTKNG